MRRCASLAAACVLLATGCGGDGEADEPARTVTVRANGELRVVGDEYSFDPARVVVTGAGRLEITLDNQGTLAHNLRLVKAGDEVGGTTTFPSGRAESGTVNLEHGSYEMVCTVGDHEELGMTGTLVVR